MLVKEIQKQFPIHYYVWNNEHLELEKLLKEKQVKFPPNNSISVI